METALLEHKSPAFERHCPIRLVLDRIAFNVAQGETVAVIGPSGDATRLWANPVMLRMMKRGESYPHDHGPETHGFRILRSSWR